MIDTKLILVDGISGSGKSTTVLFIYRQMERTILLTILKFLIILYLDSLDSLTIKRRLK